MFFCLFVCFFTNSNPDASAEDATAHATGNGVASEVSNNIVCIFIQMLAA